MSYIPTTSAAPVIITPGLIDGLLATPEEAALLEAADQRRIHDANRVLDQALQAVQTARDIAEEDAMADWLDRAEAARARRDARRGRQEVT